MDDNLAYDTAEGYFSKGNFEKAFILFKAISEDLNYYDGVRANAYNMMGVVVLFNPIIYPEDESGLVFFLKAIDADSGNIGALLNIVANFGLSVNSHKDISAFDMAIKRLEELGYKFSKSEMALLQEKNKVKQTILNLGRVSK
jgi:hypothetical protein